MFTGERNETVKKKKALSRNKVDRNALLLHRSLVKPVKFSKRHTLGAAGSVPSPKLEEKRQWCFGAGDGRQAE